MKSVLTLAVLFLAGCATPLSQTPPTGAAADVSAPTFRAGDSWLYQAHDRYTGLPLPTVEHRITSITGGTVAVQRIVDDRATEEYLTRDSAWLQFPLASLRTWRYEPALAALPFPLHAGKAWRQQVVATDPATGRNHRVWVNGRVLGWERLKVPAGEFDALKIERRIYAGNPETFRTQDEIHEVDWYAPQLGAVVRHEGRSEYLDTSRCGPEGCVIVRSDWQVLELTKAARGPTGG